MDIELKISDLDCDPLKRSEVPMIVTCPKCATRFFAADDTIGPAGRRVQCEACREVWFSEGAASAERPEPAMTDEVAYATVAEVRPPQESLAEATPATSPLFVERPSSAVKTAPKRSGRPWAITVLIAVFVVAICGLIFQADVERLWPGSAPIYHVLGVGSAQRAVG